MVTVRTLSREQIRQEGKKLADIVNRDCHVIAKHSSLALRACVDVKMTYKQLEAVKDRLTTDLYSHAKTLQGTIDFIAKHITCRAAIFETAKAGCTSFEKVEQILTTLVVRSKQKLK